MVLKGRFLGLLSGLMLAAMSSSVSALEITVNTTYDGYDWTPGDGICSDNWNRCSLRAAIMEANAYTVDAIDNIYLPPASYEMHLEGSGDNSGKRGDMDVFGGGSIVITGLGAREEVVIRGMWSLRDRLFDVKGDGHLTLKSLTLTGGHGAANWSTEYPADYQDTVHGGAVRVQGQLVVDDVVIDANVAQGDGAGIYSLQGHVSISNSVISNNEGRSFGAGVFVQEATLKVKNTLFASNGMRDFPGTIVGGAIAIFQSDVVIEGSTFTNNKAFRDGGAVYVGMVGAAAGGGVTIRNSTFYRNHADRHGGAIHVNSGSNTSGLSWYSPVKLSNLTIVDNTTVPKGEFTGDNNNADTGNPGGGLYVFNSATVEVENTLFGGNNVADLSYDCSVWGSGKIISKGNNLDTDGSCGFTESTDLSQTTDPGLDGFGDHGGPLQTVALLPDSPAVNVGSDEVCLANGSVDQRGFNRPVTGCDIGAFELEGVDLNNEVPLIIPERNFKPVAMEMVIRVAPGQVYHGVLNAADANGDELTYEIIYNANEHLTTGAGEAVLDDDYSAEVAGMFTYIADPRSDETQDMFTYRACDSYEVCSTPARVVIMIPRDAKAQGEILMDIQPLGQSSVPSSSVVVLAESDLEATTGGVDYYYPIGGLAFTVTDVPVDSSGTGRATIVVQLNDYRADLDSNAVVRKMDKFLRWHTLEATVPEGADPISTAVIDPVANTITLHLVDNDIFDLDDTVGVIDDPFAYAVPVNQPAAVEEDEGGLALGSMSWGLLLLPALMLLRRQRVLH